MGRIRIRADHADGSREIILNPRTGEFLRDLWIGGSDSQTRAGRFVGNDGGKSRGRGSDDDDDKDDDSHSGGDGD